MVARSVNRNSIHNLRTCYLTQNSSAFALLCEFDPVFDVRVHHDESLVDVSRPVELLVAQLELDIRLPGLLLGLPLHPPLEHGPTPCGGGGGGRGVRTVGAVHSFPSARVIGWV